MNILHFVAFSGDRLIRIAALFALTAYATCAQTAAALPCKYGEQQCAADLRDKHMVKAIDFWKQTLSRPVAERIGSAPPELIEYIALDNIAQEVSDQPRAVDFEPAFLLDVKAAFDELPAPVKKLVSSKLAGIYFLAGLGGTGYTDEIVDRDGNPVAGFIVFDADVLAGQTANAWATWKESTPFKAAPNIRLAAQIEADDRSDRKAAIQYIMLHELGHVVSIGERFHPRWTVQPKDVPSPSDYPFFAQSWRISKSDDRYYSVFDEAFKQRTKVAYYFGAKLGADEMLDTYSMLEGTNFATLYAATRPGDDFADSFASYVHTVILNRPFSIRIYAGDKLMKTFGACWNQPRCSGKRKILDELFGL